MQPTVTHELAILIELQKNTPFGHELRKERGQMIIEAVVKYLLSGFLKAMEYTELLKIRSLDDVPTTRTKFRAKKYSFTQMPYRGV